jgi:hypothetical protein
MNTPWHIYGQRRLAAAYQSGEDLPALLTKLATASNTPEGEEALLGAVEVALQIASGFKNMAHKVGNKLAREIITDAAGIQLLMLKSMMRGRDYRGLQDYLSTLLGVIVAIREVVPVTFNEVTQRTDDEQPKATPLQIEIVSMPTRRRVVEIMRDEEGEIDYSVQVESDAA